MKMMKRITRAVCVASCACLLSVLAYAKLSRRTRSNHPRSEGEHVTKRTTIPHARVDLGTQTEGWSSTYADGPVTPDARHQPEDDQSWRSAGGVASNIEVTDEAESPMGVDHEQALRDETYIAFDGEAEDDYTSGPARFVDASDGVKQSAALLMTMNLSKKIQRAIQAQRYFEKAEWTAMRKRGVLLNLEEEVSFEISVHECLCEQVGGSKDDEAAVTAANKELTNLRLMQESVGVQRQTLDAQLESQASMLRTFQGEVTSVLEEAYEVSGLIAPRGQEPDEPVERIELKAAYQLFCKGLQEDGEDAGDEVAHLHTFDQEPMQVVTSALTPEQQAKIDAAEAFYQAREELQNALNRFERREIDREADREGNMDEMPETFDLRWIQKYRDLTHDLVGAEEVLANAKAAAVRAGADIRVDEQSSGFGDEYDDGYRESWTEEVLSSVPRAKVDSWLVGIAESAASAFGGDVDADEWNNAGDIEICDSVSMVADGSRRRRIDRWRQVCGLQE